MRIGGMVVMMKKTAWLTLLNSSASLLSVSLAENVPLPGRNEADVVASQ